MTALHIEHAPVMPDTPASRPDPDEASAAANGSPSPNQSSPNQSSPSQSSPSQSSPSQSSPSQSSPSQSSPRAAWHTFIAEFEPHRPDLFRYGRRLSGTAWEAEDLVQEALTRAFATLATVHHPIDNPRAWLLRVATNVFLDRQRRRRERPTADPEAAADHPSPAASPAATSEARDAGQRLFDQLAPQERVAVVLKDVFDCSLDEAAAILGTTRGAIKAALHRGRGKLTAPSTGDESPPRSSTAAVDAFCAAFNERNMAALVAILLDNASAEVYGMVTEYGPAAIRDGSLHHTLFDEEGDPQAERRDYRGEPIVVLWYLEGGRRVVRDVLRFVTDDVRVAWLRYYYFCPEVLAEVCTDLGVPVKDNGYRYMRT